MTVLDFPLPPSEVLGWRSCIKNPNRVPPAFASLMDRGAILLVSGRGSADASRAARDRAITDLFAVVAQFADKTGIDFSPVLPTKTELTAKLVSATGIPSVDLEGRRFVNRYVVVDCRAEAGVVFVVSTGSGSKVNADYQQPHIQKLAELFDEYGASAFASKRLDRAGRVDWELAPLTSRFSARRAWVYDEQEFSPYNDARSAQQFLLGWAAKSQAKQMPDQLGYEQANLSDSEMVAGQARFHSSAGLAPGFGSCWLLPPGGGKPQIRIVYVDCEECRPAAETVAWGLPLPARHLTPSPIPVDQVANIRFVLTHYGRPGWSLNRLARELVARGYSTEKFRNTHGADATYASVAGARSSLRTIFANLEVYRTGVLKRGTVSGAIVEISGCFPPDGPWAEDSDFERIDATMRMSRELVQRQTSLGLVGVEATYDKIDVVLRTNKPRGKDIRLYRFTIPGSNSEVPPRSVLLPPPVLHDSIVEGFRDAAIRGIEIAPLEIFESQSAHEVELRAEISRVEAQMEEVDRAQDAIAASLEETDALGRPVMTGELLERAQERFNALSKRKLMLDRETKELEGEVTDALPLARTAMGEVSSFLQLAASVKDPLDTRFNDLWKVSIKLLTFDSYGPSKSDQRGSGLRWRGVVRLEDAAGGADVMIPFSGSYDRRGRDDLLQGGSPKSAEPDVHQIVQGMLDGQQLPPLGRVHRPRAIRGVAALLNVETDHGLVRGCDDPRILRTAAYLLLNRDVPLNKAARRLHVKLDFVRRVHHVHVEQVERRKSWCLEGHKPLAAAYALAGRNGGHTSTDEIHALVGGNRGNVHNLVGALVQSGRWTSQLKRGYAIKPCRCGSVSFAPMAIPEPVGVICLGCSRDESGLEWDMKTYSKYVAHRSLFDRLDNHN